MNPSPAAEASSKALQPWLNQQRQQSPSSADAKDVDLPARFDLAKTSFLLISWHRLARIMSKRLLILLPCQSLRFGIAPPSWLVSVFLVFKKEQVVSIKADYILRPLNVEKQGVRACWRDEPVSCVRMCIPLSTILLAHVRRPLYVLSTTFCTPELGYHYCYNT
jgi:hypothetical protein